MKKLIKLGKKLFPICRSLTGNGNLKTLKMTPKFGMFKAFYQKLQKKYYVLK